MALINEGKLKYYLVIELKYKDQNSIVASATSLLRYIKIRKLLASFGKEKSIPKARPLDIAQYF